MASSMMHYIISNQILKKYPDVDNNKFFRLQSMMG